MQSDMHFYGTYALARAAGIKPDSARIIAQASQFVDDALEDKAIELSRGKKALLPVVTSHKPLDYENSMPSEQWNVWVPFHFLPGNENTGKTFEERVVCRKDSGPARKILEHALSYKKAPFGPHLAGITAHVYADTFAHYGFAGLNRDWNCVKAGSIQIKGTSSGLRSYLKSKYEAMKTRVMGTGAEVLPVGHGSVGTFPDRPYLEWQYRYEPEKKYGDRKTVKRNNLKDFLEGCRCLHRFFRDFAEKNPSCTVAGGARAWDSIRNTVNVVLKHQGPNEERIERWKKTMATDMLFKSTNEDKMISYLEKRWKSNRVALQLNQGVKPDVCNGYLYYRAALLHRDYVLKDLLPDIGILVGK